MNVPRVAVPPADKVFDEQVKFTLDCIQATHTKWGGMHTVFDGFNDAFRRQFPGSDPVKVTTEMRDRGLVDMRYARGGVRLYLPGTMPARKDTREVKADDLLRRVNRM